MQTKIIILTGKAQSGKDTSANFIVSELQNQGYDCDTYAFAGYLKSICNTIFGLTVSQCWGDNDAKNSNTNIRWRDLPLCKGKIARLMLDKTPKTSDDFMTAREFMQVLGTDIFRKLDENCWVRSTLLKIQSDNLDFAVISDARFINEIEFLSDFNPIIIKLDRNILKNQHASETALDSYPFDKFKRFHLVNNDNMNVEETNRELKSIIQQYL